jgi:hypothetical protein
LDPASLGNEPKRGHVSPVVLTTGKVYKQTYFGRLVAEKGKIKLIREAVDTLAGRRAFSKD